MPYTAITTITQGSDKTKFTVTDASTNPGSETLTNRTLIIYKADGSVYRQPSQTVDTIDFNYTTYPTGVIEITGLDKDYAFSVVMTVTPAVVVGGSVYTVTNKFALTGYTVTEERERWSRIASNPRLEKNLQYTKDMMRLLIEKDNATVAAGANDISSAQLALDRARNIILFSKTPY